GPAVHVLGGVLLAFLGAEAAGKRAQRDGAAQDLRIRAGLRRGERARHHADIGAIEVEANALAERVGVLLRQTGIGTGGAGPRGRVALPDTGDQRRANALDLGVIANLLVGMHARPPLATPCVTAGGAGKVAVGVPKGPPRRENLSECQKYLA